jgi:hypothetical protein
MLNLVGWCGVEPQSQLSTGNNCRQLSITHESLKAVIFHNHTVLITIVIVYIDILSQSNFTAFATHMIHSRRIIGDIGGKFVDGIIRGIYPTTFE